MVQTRLPGRLFRPSGVPVALGGMLGAGVFLAPAPAATAAGGWLFAGLVLAAVTAGCSALAAAFQGASYRGPGAAYQCTREQMGVVPARIGASTYLAGRVAAMGAIGGLIGDLLLPSSAPGVAAAAILLVVIAATAGVRIRGTAAWLALALTLAILAAIIATLFAIVPEPWPAATEAGAGRITGITGAAAALFAGFLGFERVTTPGTPDDRLGGRAGWRSVRLSLAAAALILAMMCGALLYQLGSARLVLSPVPVLDALAAADASSMRTLVGVGAVLALLPVVLGTLESFRCTALALARDRELPPVLGRPGSHGTPFVLDLLGALAAVGVAMLVDPITALLFASCCALVHYAFANASTRILLAERGTGPTWVSCLGMALSVVLAMSMPIGTMLATLCVVIAGPLIMGALSGRWS